MESKILIKTSIGLYVNKNVNSLVKVTTLNVSLVNKILRIIEFVFHHIRLLLIWAKDCRKTGFQ